MKPAANPAHPKVTIMPRKHPLAALGAFSRLAMLFAVFAAALAAQTFIQQGDAIFRTGVNLVKVDAQVIDGRKVLNDLTREDFVVLDEGEPRPIEYFAHDTEPLRILLLLDISGSMKMLLEEVSAAANKALSVLGPQDEVAVMLFARSTLVHQEFTTDRKLVTEAINDARYEKRPGSSTDINSAVVEAARYMRESSGGKPGRRAIVILTDNASMSYRVPDERVMESIFAADAVLTAMVTKNARPPDKVKPGSNPDFTFADVFRWAEESGGEVLRADKGGGEAFERAVERLRTRYSLHYRGPELTDGAGTFRRIQVRLSAAGKKAHGNVQIRARSGYFLLGAPTVPQ